MRFMIVNMRNDDAFTAANTLLRFCDKMFS